MEEKSSSGVDSCNGTQLFTEAMTHFGQIVEKNLQNSKIKKIWMS